MAPPCRPMPRSAPRSSACSGAQDEMPPVPKALQAQLRPYQEDGYQWAMRLASAGLGGCLADDMGLGKTLQGLAVLLARGAGGRGAGHRADLGLRQLAGRSAALRAHAQRRASTARPGATRCSRAPDRWTW